MKTGPIVRVRLTKEEFAVALRKYWGGFTDDSLVFLMQEEDAKELLGQIYEARKAEGDVPDVPHMMMGVGYRQAKEEYKESLLAEAQTQLRELRADNAQLRKALEDIVSWGEKFDAKGTHSKRVVERAQAALLSTPRKLLEKEEKGGG